MTRRTPTPITAATVPAEQPDDEQDTQPVERRAYARWDAETKEKAAALLTSGYSLHAASRALNVPRTTLREFQVSTDPVAVELRELAVAALISKSWEIADEMLEKLRTAPVRSVQEAAVAYGIVTERALMMEARAKALTPGDDKITMMDLVDKYEEYQAEIKAHKAAALPRPTLTATVAEQPQRE